MNPSRFTLCALAGAVTLALQVQAFAEESTIVVTGSEQGSVLPSWTNSATKSAVAESKTPQVINTLSAQEIDKRHANSVNEILRYAPGVSTEVRGNTSYMSEYKIRDLPSIRSSTTGCSYPITSPAIPKPASIRCWLKALIFSKVPHRYCTAEPRRVGW